MKKLFFSLIVLLAIVLSSYSTFAQGSLGLVGKVFEKVEANNLYGKVIESKAIDTQKIFDMLKKVEDYIMFTIKDGEIVIADKYRNLLSDTKIVLSEFDVMHLYSKARVDEVLLEGGKPVTYLEIRSDVFTITNGEYTLEMSMICPPICP